MSLGIFNSIILPLLGGYLLLTAIPFSRFFLFLSSGPVILASSAAAGLVVQYLLAAVLTVSRGCIAPFDTPLIGWLTAGCNDPTLIEATRVATFLVGALLWGVFRAFASHPPFRLWGLHAKTHWNSQHGDFMQLKLDYALLESKPVQHCLKSGKCYVGTVHRTANTPSAIRSVQILPLRSGFRQPTTPLSEIAPGEHPSDIVYSKDYDEHFRRAMRKIVHEARGKATTDRARALRDGLATLQADLEIVIAASEIQTLSVYNDWLVESRGKSRVKQTRAGR